MATIGYPQRPFEARSALTTFAFLLLSCLPFATALGGQTTDSLRLIETPAARQARKQAQDAQEAFEGMRRRQFPISKSWGSGPCDALVGRMCWRHQGVMRWHPHEEAQTVTEARNSLLLELEIDAQAAPGDPWILGQRVRYLLEAGRIGEAQGLASQCRGSLSWWCMALEGLTLHLQGRYPEAERAFDRALMEMDPELAREWDDPGPLLERDARGLLSRASEDSPERRDSLVRRLWHLSDPFFLVPGNDRRTEHLARRTWARIFSDSATPHSLRWGSDMEELLVRYGWERAWERIPSRPGEVGGLVGIVGYEHPDVRSFIPPAKILAEPTGELSKPWVASMSPYTRSGYAPAYAPVVLPMDSRLLVLTRGNHALVAATFRLPADTTYRTREGIRDPHLPPPAFRSWPLRAGLVLAEGGKTPLHASLEDGRTQGVLMLDVPAGEYLVSVEALDPDAGRAGRIRNGLRVPAFPPDLPVLSDLLLVEGDSLPHDTQEALARLRIGDELPSGEPLGVGWEIWGLGWQEEMVRYRLSLESSDPGLLERFRRLFGGESNLPILEWEEPGPEQPGPAFQSVALAFPAVDPGVYTITLEVRLAGREPMVSRQRIRVLEAGGDTRRPPP